MTLTGCGIGQNAAITLPIAITDDTFLAEAAPDSINGISASLVLNGTAGSRRPVLLMPDLSGIPVGATIISATLALTCGVQNINAANISIHRILAVNTGWIELSSWNHRDGAGATQHWAGDAGGDGGADAGCSVSGTDYAASVIGLFTIANNDPIGTVYNVALDTTEFATLAANNYGLILISDLAAAKTLASSEHATPAYHPLLTVIYQS